jgi:hypothetical protein
MARYSSKDGTVKSGTTEIKPVNNWKLTLSSENPKYVANDTSGWTGRVAGVKDASGSFDMEADSSHVAPFEEGDTATVNLYVDGTSGVCYYQVPIIVDKVDVECDFSGKTVVGYKIAFSSTGAVIKFGFFAASGV